MVTSRNLWVDYSRTEQTAFRKTAVGQIRAVVVGAGAIGNEVTKALGLLGCGQVSVIDPDVVEPHNLTRSILYRTEEAVGRNKSATLVRACRHCFPDTAWVAVETEVAGAGLEHIAQADILFGCVDNELARLEIAYIGTKFDLPVCDAGLGGENYAKLRISFFPGRDSACFSCMLLPARRRELLTLWDCESFPCWIERGRGTGWPGTPTAAAVAGSMQVDVGLRRLFEHRVGQRTRACTIELALDPPGLCTFEIPFSRECPFHNTRNANTTFTPAASSLSVRELLDIAARTHSGEPVLVLDWPICLSATCRVCRHQWSPMTRLAAMRRSGACPACMSSDISLSRTVHRLSRSSELASHRLRELGMPEQNLYTIEFVGSGKQ